MSVSKRLWTELTCAYPNLFGVPKRSFQKSLRRNLGIEGDLSPAVAICGEVPFA